MKSVNLFLTLLLVLSISLDLDAKTKRSAKARAFFQIENPCPSTGKIRDACPGYIIDHIIPLKRGGADHPSNMQWQTIEKAKEKDRWE